MSTESNSQSKPQTKNLESQQEDRNTSLILFLKRLWHKSPATIISIFALLFSFSTTIVSYYRTQNEDIQLARTELRGILQRLSYLPIDTFEFNQKHKNNPQAEILSGNLNQENSLLVQQASEIIDKFPNEISAIEYLSVSLALINAGDLEKVPKYFDSALKITSDPNVKVTTLRYYGNYYMSVGQTTPARRKFEEALTIWQDYPNVTEFFKKSTNAITEMNWAQSEFSVNNIEARNEHIRKSSEIIKSLPSSEFKNNLLLRLNFIQEITTTN